MRRIADKGHPHADALRAAADAFEKASNEFHADRDREARAFELAWQGFATPEVETLLTFWREAHRVLSQALTPPPGSVESWIEQYE
jgi:hypothetical protein